MQLILKYIFCISSITCISTIAYSQGKHAGSDTFYSATTKQLKSNKIPDSVFNITSLRMLSIQGDDCDRRIIDANGKDVTQCWMINEIPSQIKNLKNLATLRITLNAITVLPKEISELKNLKLIDLIDGGLLNVDAVIQITGLEYLYLYGCQIEKMPENIGNLKNLKELGLAGNHIEASERERIRKALPNCRIIF